MSGNEARVPFVPADKERLDLARLVAAREEGRYLSADNRVLGFDGLADAVASGQSFRVGVSDDVLATVLSGGRQQ